MPTPAATAGPVSESSVQSAPEPATPEVTASAPLATPSAAAAGTGDRVLVASLGKAVPAPLTATPLRLTRRTVPIFPTEAIRAGIESGRVVARLTVEADGHVSETRIMSASPLGYFERESRRALASWRYEPPGQTTSVEVELQFNRN
jgi:TonB family protein